MKPFDLEAALQGEPVKLRTGAKAIVLYRVPEHFTFPNNKPMEYPLKGLVFTKNGNISAEIRWTIDGHCNTENINHDADIIDMWEEPTPTVTLTLPKPFKPKQGETYYSISDRYTEPEANIAVYLNAPSIVNGNCFRKEEDAQAWIDAMREAVCE